MKILILRGLQASGKSTFAKEFVANNIDWVRVNRDDLRNMRGKYWIPEQERLITKWERDCVYAALCSGYNVILDATNLNSKFLKDFKQFFEKAVEGTIIEEKFFEVPLEECIRRDSLRTEGKVGAEVIMNTYKKYLL